MRLISNPSSSPMSVGTKKLVLVKITPSIIALINTAPTLESTSFYLVDIF